MADERQTIVDILASMTGREASTLSETTRLAEDLHIKSVDRMALTGRIEDALGTTLTVFDILKARTVADVIALVAPQPAASG